VVDATPSRSYVDFVHLRQAALQSVIAALIGAAWASWSFLHPASVGNYFVVAAILFLPFLGLRLIIYVGGVLLADERARNGGVERDHL
jgi:hypothetical protein